MAVLDKSELDAIYRDMLARVEMGLTSDNGVIEANMFVYHLREAIAEKLPKDKVPDATQDLDIFSVVYGALSERILREYYNKYGKEWW